MSVKSDCITALVREVYGDDVVLSEVEAEFLIEAGESAYDECYALTNDENEADRACEIGIWMAFRKLRQL